MTRSRLAQVVEAAGGWPAMGTVALLRPGAVADLSDPPRARTEIVETDCLAHETLVRAGWRVSTGATGPYAAAVVFQQRARDAMRALVADAARATAPGAPIWVDGQRHDGIDSTLAELGRRLRIDHAVARAHGRAFGFSNPGAAAFADWAATPREVRPGFVTLPGVFSADGVDRASALLADALPETLGGCVADLGAGWGWLAAAVLARKGVGEVHLVECDHVALDCARRNLRDPRARFHWADATRWHPRRPCDAVVMNPPFHRDRSGDPRLGQEFIAAAGRMLAPSGELWMVANRHLPYEKVLAQQFRAVAETGGDGTFKILHAQGPVARHVVRRPGGRRQ